MITIPLAAVPSQTLSVILGGQPCKIAVYQLSSGVFLDLTVTGVLLVSCAICRDRTAVLRYPYINFVGDLAFVDTQGSSDPDYTGFGTRFQLGYLP